MISIFLQSINNVLLKKFQTIYRRCVKLIYVDFAVNEALNIKLIAIKCKFKRKEFVTHENFKKELKN